MSKLRVLHLSGALVHGGIETWLVEMVRKSDRKKIEIDVCVTMQTKGAYEKEFEQLGGRIHRCPLRKNIFAFNRDLRRILSEGGYDILHCHFYFASGYFLRVASKVTGLRLVAHMHPTVDFATGRRMAFPRPLYQWLMKRWIYRYADAILGASEATLELIWGPNWRQDSRFVFQPNGIDISEFEQPVDPVEIRRELGIPSDSRIVLTVGRYVPHKKHILIPEIAKRLCKNHPNLYFVIAGSGPLYGQVEERIRQLGLEERFRLLRGLPSLIGLWKSSDAFLFPSTQEGFGIVVIEAAAGGLPIVARRIPGVTEAASACKNAILLEDKATVEQWADAVTKALAIGRTQINDYKGFAKDFKFTSQKSFDVLSGVYERIMQNNRVGGTK